MMKRLLGCVGEYKRDSFLAPLFVTGEVILEVIIPFLMSYLIDQGIQVGNMQKILQWGGILVALTVLSLAFGALSGKHAARASAGFASNLRRKMFYNVQEFSFSNMDKFSASSIVTRLTTDVSNIQNSYQMVIRTAVRCPVMLVSAFLMARAVNSRLSLVFLAVIPILGIGLYLAMSSAHPIFERVFHTYDRLNRVVQENLRGVRVVKSYVRAGHEKEKFNTVSDSIYRDFSRAEKILAANAPLMQFCMYTCILTISWVGAHMIVGQQLSTGQLMSMITYSTQILMSLMMVSMVFVMIVVSRASVERVCEVLAEESDLKNGEDPVYEVPNGSVEFDGVDFSYTGNPDKLALRGVNFSAAPGQTVGIIGGTGSAKTTMVQLIARLYDVTGGSVKVGGIDVREYDIKTLRDEVAMVLQKNVLFSGSIAENLRWGKENATDEEIVHACKLAQADEFIRSFPDGYQTHIEQDGANVSGGQKQRLCIARALIKKPKILILDDSTSAVDTRTDALIRKAFLEEIPHTTKFIIAQRISSVSDADMIIVMDGGMVNAIGTHEELLAQNAIYQEVYYSQQKGEDDRATD
ncbi:MAG: ABC transporter ATP-binding protein [Ruminococcaceae bacterium]|nr:ABC transporter ATP-binding protein [Oscillospiraceae bacterium]